MAKRELHTQTSLDLELRGFEEVLGTHFCELVEGEVPSSFEEERTDGKLQHVLRRKIKELLDDPTVPKFVLYQLPAGQQSLICLSVDENRKLLVGYRDLDSRAPTQRVKQSVDDVVKEFLE